MTRTRIEELLSRAGPRIRTRFRQVMQRVKDRWTVARLEAALEAGTISEVLDDIEKAGEALAAQTAEEHNRVASAAAAWLSTQTDRIVSYDAGNDGAVQALRQDRLRLVSGLRDEHREIILDAISDGTAQGANPREQARAIRDSLGLTRQQAEWVRSYDRALRNLDPNALDRELRDARRDPTVERAIDAGKPLASDVVDKMVARYADQAIKYRAEVIARTEALRAVNVGADAAFAQAIDNGALDRSRVVCTWHAGHPPRTRNWHATMNGQERPWGEGFVSGKGNVLRFPCDPNAPPEETIQCRCAVSRRILPPGAKAPAATSGASAPSAVDAHDQRADVTPLLAPVDDVKLLGGGINESFVVRLENGRRAVYKPDVTRFDDHPSLAYRERAASMVAGELGVADLVPPTTLREVTTEQGTAVGSVQAWVRSAKRIRATDALDVAAVQRMRVFDFVTGNSDRHDGNVLWRKVDDKLTPALIDNGFSLPEGPVSEFVQPGLWTHPLEQAPMSATALRQIRGADPRTLATTLHAAGIAPVAIRHALYRLAVLKRDPQVLGVFSEDLGAERRRWAVAATGAEGILTVEQRAEIDRLVAEVTAR